MDMTLLDFIAECEAYPYSKDAFAIDRDIASLTILESYIESAEWFDRTDCTPEVIEEHANFFYQNLNQAYVEAGDKLGSIKDALHRRLKAIMTKMGAFMVRIADRHDQITPKARACVKILQQRELSTGDMRKIIDILKKGDKQRDLFAPFNKQPFAAQFHIVYMENDKNINAGAVNQYLASVLSDSVVAANVGFIHIDPPIQGSTVGVVSFDTLVDACTKLFSKNGGPAAAAGAIISGWAHTKQNGLVFKTDSNSVRKDVKTLETLNDKVNEVMTARTAHAKVNDGAIAGGANAALASAIQKLLIATIGATMRVYNGYLAYRTYVVLNLYEYLQTLE